MTFAVSFFSLFGVRAEDELRLITREKNETAHYRRTNGRRTNVDSVRQLADCLE
jgi:hypothetical protein